jgi:hypothetical protein
VSILPWISGKRVVVVMNPTVESRQWSIKMSSKRVGRSMSRRL